MDFEEEEEDAAASSPHSTTTLSMMTLRRGFSASLEVLVRVTFRSKKSNSLRVAAERLNLFVDGRRGRGREGSTSLETVAEEEGNEREDEEEEEEAIPSVSWQPNKHFISFGEMKSSASLKSLPATN